MKIPKQLPLPKKYQKAIRDLAVKKSIAGLGLFTNAPIEKGGFIIEYFGTYMTEDEADARGGKYLFEVGKNKFVDGTARVNTARYINHSCQPSCEIDIRAGRIYVFAKRAIKPGEELFYDYGEEYFNEHIKPFGCRCEKCVQKKGKK